jgi:hypothetical protein
MIKLELTVDEVNMILRVLSKHPFEEVFTVIAKIKQQGDAQVTAADKAAPTEVPAA